VSKDADYAFPLSTGFGTSLGLTKRELFAAMAMQGFAASKYKATADEFARYAVMMADDLLAELEKPA
jgi:hypothetical protein